MRIKKRVIWKYWLGSLVFHGGFTLWIIIPNLVWFINDGSLDAFGYTIFVSISLVVIGIMQAVYHYYRIRSSAWVSSAEEEL